jgi:hypothetical protein
MLGEGWAGERAIEEERTTGEEVLREERLAGVEEEEDAMAGEGGAGMEGVPGAREEEERAGEEEYPLPIVPINIQTPRK